MMKKIIFILTSVLLISALCKAQGTLQFNQIKVINTTVAQTVPAGKVWKVTAIYGSEIRENQCVDMSTNSTHEIGVRMRCGASFSGYNTISGYFTYFIRKIKINGVDIITSLSGIGRCPVGNLYQTNNCSSSAYGCDYWTNPSNFACGNQSTDPNILPMWLAPGTTIATGGSNTFLSAIEFNVIP